MTVNESYFCSCLTVDKTNEWNEERAALLLGAKWPAGSPITIRFLGGAAALQERVKAVAKTWTDLANLKFLWTTKAPTDIRIAFLPGKGSWSYLGTQCRHIEEPKPTMNYGWLTPDSSDDEVRRVVLHEFGHAVGLIHEHQSPSSGGIKWNVPAVVKDLSSPPNKWDLDTIKTNMFKKYEDVIATPAVDSLSIMMYPIPKAWTLDGTQAGLNAKLSDKDIEFIKKQYPK